MSNLEKLHHRIKTGFPRCKDNDGRCAEIYQILERFDDMVLHEVNDRFLDLYTKKQFPNPIEIERICHQVKRERELRTNATTFTSKSEKQRQADRFDDLWAIDHLDHFGARAVDEGWHVEYYGYLARNARQPGERDIDEMRTAATARASGPYAEIHRKKADNIAEVIRAQLNEPPKQEKWHVKI